MRILRGKLHYEKEWEKVACGTKEQAIRSATIKEQNEKRPKRNANKKEEMLSKMKYPFKTKAELCPHFHRVDVDEETGIEQNRPAEELWEEIWMSFFGEQRKAGYRVKVSDLAAISDTQCQCRTCDKIFPGEKVGQMERLFERLNELSEYIPPISPMLDITFMKLCDGLEPVWYRKVFQSKQEYFVDNKYDTEIETEWCPTKWKCYTKADQGYFGDHYLDKTPIQKYQCLPNIRKDGYRGCRHYGGNPHLIIKHVLTLLDVPGGVEIALHKWIAEWLEHPKDLDIIDITIGDDFRLKRRGGVYPLLQTMPDGICRCKNCGREFCDAEQKQFARLLGYLNAPHYRSIDDIPELSEQELGEWREILSHYDYGYTEEDEPFTVFDVDKAVELTKGIEPVLYEEGDYKGVKSAKVLSVLRWENGTWVMDE